MPKLKIVSYFMLALITLAFASCATTQPQATTSTSNQTHSPLERDNGNGLASLIH